MATASASPDRKIVFKRNESFRTVLAVDGGGLRWEQGACCSLASTQLQPLLSESNRFSA